MLKRIVSDKFLLVLLLSGLTAAAILFFQSTSHREMPLARGGVMDLSDWDLAGDGIVPLDGEWEFYPHQLLGPSDFQSASPRPVYVTVPSTWTGTGNEGEPAMEPWGYGTYRLILKIKPTKDLLAFKKQAVRFSDKIYVDGRLLGQSGQPGKSREEYKPGNTPYDLFFQTTGDQIELIVQAANFEYNTGGIGLSQYFGLSQDILKKKYVQSTLEAAGMIVLFIFGAFYLTLYWLFQRRSSFLIFGAFFIFSGLALVFNGEKLAMQLLTGLPFEILWKIKDFSVYIAIPLLSVYTYGMYEGSKLRNMLLLPICVFSGYCLSILTLPFHWYVQLEDMAMIGVILFYSGLAGVLLISYIKRNFGGFHKSELQFYISAILTLALTAFGMSLYYSRVITSMTIANLSVFAFILLIAMMLAQRYFHIYTSMARLTQQLKTVNHMKDEFLLRTSHELKTPLHGIISLSQAVIEGSGRGNPAAQSKEKLMLIRNTAYRMANTVNDIIDLAKIKDRRLEVKMARVDLVTCTSIIFEVFGFLAKEKNIVLVNRIDLEARYAVSDENRLMQVLYNLINNSLNHTAEGAITVTSRLDQNQIILSIEDNGGAVEGFVQDNLDRGKEWDPDAPLPASSTPGVGLSIVKELIGLMGGRLSLKMVEGKAGPQIEVSLPASQAEDTDNPPLSADKNRLMAQESNERLGSGSYTILIVDDEAINIELMVNILSIEGYRVIMAHSDQEALEKIGQGHPPDLVLLDVMIPGSSGYEVSRQIRKLYSQIELPILFVTVRNTPADVEAGLAAGGNDFITKPLDAGELRIRISTLLAMKKLAKEAALSELAFLQSQIKPHFLYNALGTIMSLCYTDGPRAGELLAVLSRYLRIIFHLNPTEETVSLSKEMELIQAYATIEQARFGERIQMIYDVNEELMHCNVLPLSIQPLVENAIRHGVAKKINGGTVRLSIQKEGELMKVVVEDNGVGMSQQKINEILARDKIVDGVGFANISKRVLNLTGRMPLVESEIDKGTKVAIWLPVSY